MLIRIDEIRSLAQQYNDRKYFEEDPLIFPRRFAQGLQGGRSCLQDVEIAAILAAHLAWGRRAMIVRDCGRLFDEMDWRPYDYVMKGDWKNDPTSLHRTIKWSEIAGICSRLRDLYQATDSLENLSVEQWRCDVLGSRRDPSAPNKKINLMRRWMVRRDCKVDLGVWKNSDPADLIIPLDVHVHRQSVEMGITSRKSGDLKTALEITSVLGEIFPGDPCLGDFALFGYGVTHPTAR